MKSRFQIILAFSCVAWLLGGCSRKASEPAAKEAPPAAAQEPESRVKHGTNGEVFVTLDAATQKTMGLQTAALAPAQLKPEIKGYGRVLDPAPLVSLVADLTTAQAQSAASDAELTRLKTLATQENASQRALQAAEAAAARDLAQLTAARARLLSAWGAVARRDDLPAFVQSLVSLEDAIVEVDLPPGEATNSPVGARILTLDPDAKPIEAALVGSATQVDPRMQGRGFLFLVASNVSRLLPGAAVTAYLQMPGEPLAGVSVPRDAVIRFDGATWIYVQLGDDRFQRKEVALEHPLESGWFVSEGLRGGDKVVTVGAQELLSEESKGSGD